MALLALVVTNAVAECGGSAAHKLSPKLVGCMSPGRDVCYPILIGCVVVVKQQTSPLLP